MEQKKPSLLFIHGFRGNHLGLESVANKFKDYDVHIPDIPPFGNSKALHTYTADTYAGFIAGYISAQGLEKPVLIGHSMGSLIAAATAEKYPELINRKLILMAPISVKPPKAIAVLQPLVTAFPNKVVSHVTTTYLIIPRDRELYKEALNTTYVGAKNYTSRADVRFSAAFSANHSIRDFNFENDTLLLAGEKDRLILRKQTERLAHEIDAMTCFIPKTGHLLNYEDPENTARAIRSFLEAQS